MTPSTMCLGVLGAAALISACGMAGGSASGVSARAGETKETFEGPVPRANCGPGSIPEPEENLQGEPPDAASEGYRCNLELVGQQDGPSSQMLAWYEDCAYYGQESTNLGAGSVVVDASDPTRPEAVGYLTTPAMLDPHESLKVDERTGLLAAVAGWDPLGNGPVYFDLYDVATDCTRPAVKASVPFDMPAGHEGDFSADGTIYYASSLYFQTITAIDVSDAAQPTIITVLPLGSHGLANSADGNRLYLASSGVGGVASINPTTSSGNGLVIIDSSQVQARASSPLATKIGEVTWADGSAAQLPVPLTIRGKPYILFTDEVGAGAARIIDIANEEAPFVVSKLKLELNMAGMGNGHYCNVDRFVDPTIAVCTYYNSGLRVFDIRNPFLPKEIAYYNEPGTDPVSDVRVIAERRELWFTARPHGFRIVRFTNGVWPFAD